MKWIAFIFLFSMIFTSCSSFNRMRYRHLNKVPASPGMMKGSGGADDVLSENSIDEQVVGDTGFQTIPPVKLIPDSADAPPLDQRVSSLRDSLREIVRKNDLPKLYSGKFNVRRDWSVAIALVMIFGGLMLLLYCIFLLPAVNVYPIVIIALELFFIYSAIRLIVYGFNIIRSRLRKPDSYKEK